MEDFGERAAFPPTRPPRPRRSGRRWLLFGGIALALTLALMISSLLGYMLGISQAQATSAAPTGQLVLAGQAGAPNYETPTVVTGTPGPCGGELTVSRVSNHTITVTGPNGNTDTVYVTAHTNYTQYGHPVSLSAVKGGSKIYVVGSCANQGRRINATSIEIVS